MNETERLMNKARRVTAAILGLAAMSMLFASHSFFWPAMLFGLSIGYLNLEILYRRVGKSDPNDPAVSHKLMRTGSGLRFSAAALGALAMIKFQFSLLGYAAGLTIPQAVITLVFGLQNLKRGKG